MPAATRRVIIGSEPGAKHFVMRPFHILPAVAVCPSAGAERIELDDLGMFIWLRRPARAVS